MKSILMTAGLIGAVTLAWAAKDPVLMTVNGLDVPKSEFEYLYHKNSQQQLEPQPLSDYVEMFKIYKLKVADAKAEGIDTTAAFIKEMNQYRHELAAPYLADSAYLDYLVDTSLKRSAQEAEAIHIMLAKPQGTPSATLRNRADSIRQAILGGASFDEMAEKFSQDRASSSKGGNMGFITVNRLPYHFEEVAFSLPEGEISEVVESPVGYHILKGGRKRPARGSMLATHILKMVPQGATRAQEEAAEQWIDSIYNVLQQNPLLFERIATNENDDRGSARQAGRLPWFSAGMMVPEFDEAAFSLTENGEISKPVRSQFGWHIIKRLDRKAPEGREELKAELLPRFQNRQDERSKMVRDHTLARLEKKHKGTLNRKVYDDLRQRTLSTGMDSAYFELVQSPEYAAQTLFTVGKKPYTVGDFMGSVRLVPIPDGNRALYALDNYFDLYHYQKFVEAEEDWLEANQPDYRNLLNEYRDGSLLYEVSVQKVWDKASKDTEGLQKYFEANRDNYTWKRPHVKGLLVQAADDSVAGAVRRRLSELGGDTIVATIRKDFGKQASIEPVLVEQGMNAMVDNLMFDGPAVKPSSAAYTVYFLYHPVVLMAPEEVSDVRGMVTSDYQNQLESDWVEELKGRYPVTVNEKVLKKVK